MKDCRNRSRWMREIRWWGSLSFAGCLQPRDDCANERRALGPGSPSRQDKQCVVLQNRVLRRRNFGRLRGLLVRTYPVIPWSGPGNTPCVLLPSPALVNYDPGNLLSRLPWKQQLLVEKNRGVERANERPTPLSPAPLGGARRCSLTLPLTGRAGDD